ncbi:unnamed protein product [Sphagnum balticum]
MQTVSNLFLDINTFNNMMDSSDVLYVNLASSTGKIQGWINAMENYRLGMYVDASPTLTTEDNPYVAIKQLNLYTNNGTNGVPPTCSFDYWVFDSTNCTFSANEVMYVSSTPSNGVYFPPTGTLCISFNTKLSSASSNSWEVSDFATRYKTKKNCNGSIAAYNEIISYATSLTNYRDSRINLYQSLEDQLNALLTLNNQFNANISTFHTNIQSFSTGAATLNSLVTNQELHSETFEKKQDSESSSSSDED